MSQVVDRWQTRGIYVVSQYDDVYPVRLKQRLGEDAPPVLYGSGDIAALETGGLAVVGSRNVDADLIEYAEDIGRLAARSGQTLVSGGARGIDRSAMRGALESGGKVVGVLADSLERMVMNREHRNALMEGELSLFSPYDPNAGFNVGHAMQRNKLIYALSDAAIVVSSDYQKGGTWAGAVEQLDRLRFVPIYVRSESSGEPGITALMKKGALPWPNPKDADAFVDLLAARSYPAREIVVQDQLSFVAEASAGSAYGAKSVYMEDQMALCSSTDEQAKNPADELFAKVRELLERIDGPKTDAEIAELLGVTKAQAKDWLDRLVKAGVMQNSRKPVRYFAEPKKQQSLFE